MDALGTELPQRHSVAYALLVAAVVLAVPCVRMAQRSWGESGGTAVGAWAMTAVMVLVLVLVPLLLARSILTRHTYVSAEAVTITRGDVVRQQVAYDDLTEVRVRFSGRGGDTMRNDKVFLVGRLTTGRGAVLVSRFQVETLQPLLQRLAVEVAERPELLTSDVERDYFEHALATAP
jgi:hypothetical protein